MLDNKIRIIVIIVILIFIILGITLYIYMQNSEEEFTSFEENVENDTIINEIEENKTVKIIIHIAGEVNNPGVISLDENSRVIDAINLAGGLTENALIDEINLAHIVEDEEKVYIPSKHEIEEGKSEEIKSSNNSNTGSSIVTTISSKININSANITELQKIPGIGETIASRIIEYRKQNGKFKNVEELKNVSGIGEAKFNKIKEYVFM